MAERGSPRLELPPPRPAPARPRRALVSRLRRIGDAILALPVLDAIHEAFPDCAIDFLAEREPAQAAVGHPAVDRVFTLARAFGSVLPAPPDLLWKLRQSRYDWVIDLYGNPRSALLAAWTGAPVRVGPTRGSRARLYTHRIPPVADPLSAVSHHLLSLRVLGLSPRAALPRIYLSDRERAEGRGRLDAALPPGGPRVGIHAGNRWPAKRWPEERFAAVLRSLHKVGARGVLLAGPGEEDLARRITRGAGLPHPSAAGGAPILANLALRANWGVVAALDALVTVDGSPLHAGPALQVPTVGILGPTVPEIWFPYDARDGHELLCREIWCRPCHRHECARMDCLDWIGVKDVIEAVGRALSRGKMARASA